MKLRLLVSVEWVLTELRLHDGRQFCLHTSNYVQSAAKLILPPLLFGIRLMSSVAKAFKDVHILHGMAVSGTVKVSMHALVYGPRRS